VVGDSASISTGFRPRRPSRESTALNMSLTCCAAASLDSGDEMEIREDTMGAGQDWHGKKHGNNIDAMGDLGTIPVTRSQDTVKRVGGFVVSLATEIGVRSK